MNTYQEEVDKLKICVNALSHETLIVAVNLRKLVEYGELGTEDNVRIELLINNLEKTSILAERFYCELEENREKQEMGETYFINSFSEENNNEIEPVFKQLIKNIFSGQKLYENITDLVDTVNLDEQGHGHLTGMKGIALMIEWAKAAIKVTSRKPNIQKASIIIQTFNDGIKIT